MLGNCKERKGGTGSSDLPLKGRWTYGDPIAQICAAVITVELASLSSSPVVIQGSG